MLRLGRSFFDKRLGLFNKVSFKQFFDQMSLINPEIILISYEIIEFYYCISILTTQKSQKIVHTLKTSQKLDKC